MTKKKDLKFNYYNITTQYDNNWKIKRKKEIFVE